MSDPDIRGGPSSSSGGRPSAFSHRKTRSLFRNYYGIGEDEEKTEKPDPSNIDNSAFDSQAYSNRLMKAKNLQQLIQTQSSMMKEIKELDSGMKTLVYENYNKFISATDTIRQMKKNVINMEEEMNRLSGNIKEITIRTNNINEKLAPNRSTIEKLSGVSSLLRKRQFLFELPTRLKKCIELGAYGQAVKWYIGTRYILDKYKHLSSFNSIAQESELIIEQLKTNLRQSVFEGQLKVEAMTENVGLLLDLKEDMQTLCQHYLDWRVKTLTAQLTRVARQDIFSLELPEDKPPPPPEEEEEIPEKPAEPVKDDPADRPPDFMDEDDKGSSSQAEQEEEAKRAALFGTAKKTVKPVKTEAELYEEKYPSPQNPEQKRRMRQMKLYLDNSSRFFLGEAYRFGQSFSELFVQRARSSEENKSLMFLLMSHIRQLFATFSELIVHRMLELEADTYGVIYCLDGMSQMLTQFSSDITVELQPVFGMNIRIANLISMAVLQFMQTQYQKQQTSISARIDQLSQTLAERQQSKADKRGSKAEELHQDPLGHICDNLAADIYDKDIKTYFDVIKPLFDLKSQKHFLARYTPKFLESARNFILQLLQDVSFYSNEFDKNLKNQQKTVKKGQPSKQFDPSFLLLLARLCLQLENDGISRGEFYIKELAHYVDPTRKHQPNSDFEPVQASLNDTAQHLLSSYVREQGTKLSQMIRKGVETSDWLSPKVQEPHDVRKVIELVLEDIISIDDQVGEVFEDSPSAAASSNKKRSVRALGASGHERNITKLFEKKITIFGAKLDYNTQSILTGIIKICLKSFAECVRLRTFGKFGFQQIQVDCYFLRNSLRNYVDAQTVLDSLLDEVLASAQGRCIEPLPMERNIVRSICEQKLAKERS